MTDPTPTRPEPVLAAAKLAGAVSGLVVAVGAVFVLVGWVSPDEVQQWAVIAGGIVTALGAVLAAALPLITAHGARGQVTPLADPRGVNGDPLVAFDPPGAHAADNPNRLTQEH
jgi:hypothetical protein